MPSVADTAACIAAERWGRAVRDRCGQRHVCGPTFDLQSYANLPSLLKTGTDAEVLHATVRALPVAAARPGELSDGLVTLFHEAPNLEGLVLVMPEASSAAVLDALHQFERPEPGPRRAVRLREIDGRLTFAGKAIKGTSYAGYGSLAHNASAVTGPHFEDSSPVRSLHTHERLVWATDLSGVTTPERYTSTGAEVPLAFPASAEALIGTDDGRVAVSPFQVVATEFDELVVEQCICVDAILAGDEATDLKALCNNPGNAGKFEPIFNRTPAWLGRLPDSAERTAWYPGPKEGASALTPVTRICQQVEAACGTKLPYRKWGFVRVTKYTVAGTLTPRQAWHRDVDRALYPDNDHAFSCLIPVTHDIVDDGMCGQYIHYSAAGFPDPWQPVSMTATVGQGWVFNSRTIHRGGSVPRAAPGDRVMLFISLSETPYDYDKTCPVIPPFWAPPDDVPPPLPLPDAEGNEPEQEGPALDPLNPAHACRFDAPMASSSSSSVATGPAACACCTRELTSAGAVQCLSPSCRRSVCADCAPTNEYCHRCATQTDPAMAAASAAPVTGAVGPSSALNAFATDGNTHLALWVTGATAIGEPRGEDDDIPTYDTCPMRAYHWHAFPSLETVRNSSDLRLLYVRPSSVAVARNVVGGVAWTEGPPETRGPPMLWRWLMMPRGIRPTDPSVLVRGHWVETWDGEVRAPAYKRGTTTLWCACQQVSPAPCMHLLDGSLPSPPLTCQPAFVTHCRHTAFPCPL